MPRPPRVLAAAAGVAALLTAPAVDAVTVAQPPRPFKKRLRAPARSQQVAFAQTRFGGAEPKSYAVTKVRTIPHVDKPWTQGLEFSDDGQLIETSGDYPFGTGSYVRVVDQETGEPTRRITDGLARPVFIEGISELPGGRWFASTYEDHVAVEYDRDFNFVKNHPFPWEGWGLARSPDKKSFLATNSSEWLLHLDADNFQLLAEKPAMCRGKRVAGLNELEMVDDFMGKGPALLGNLINTRVVLVLDPETAECTGVFHLNDLEPITDDEAQGNHVANGIAFNKQSGNFWVTGKNWDSMFEITVSEDSTGVAQEAVMLLDLHLSRLAESDA